MLMRMFATLLLIGSLLLFTSAPTQAQQRSSLACTFHSAVSASGNGTVCDVAGYTMIAIQVTATTMGVFSIQGSVDETNYSPLLCYGVPSLVIIGSSSTAGTYRCSVRGYARVRVALQTAPSSLTAKGLAMMGEPATP